MLSKRRRRSERSNIICGEARRKKRLNFRLVVKGEKSKYVNVDHFNFDELEEGQMTWPVQSGELKGVSVGRDKDGLFCCTHRCRSKSYPSVDKIPKSKIKFIESTGSKVGRLYPHLPNSASGCMVFCPKTKRFLFPFRSAKVWDPKTWGVWGGKVEGGESFQAAAVRELEEESGYVAKDPEIKIMSHIPANDKEYCVFLVIVEDEFEPRINEEHDHATWLSYDMFPKENLSLGLKRVYENCGKQLHGLVSE